MFHRRNAQENCFEMFKLLKDYYNVFLSCGKKKNNMKNGNYYYKYSSSNDIISTNKIIPTLLFTRIKVFCEIEG